TGHAPPLLVLAPHQVPWPFRGHHEDVHVRGWRDLLVVDVEAVPEGQVLAGLEASLQVPLVDLGPLLVGHEHHDDVALAGGGGRAADAQTGLLGLRSRGAVGAHPHPDVAATVAQVERVRMPLAPVADDGDRLPPQPLEVRVLIVEDLHAARSLSLVSTVRRRVPRNIATFPVRTISLMPIGFSSSIRAFTLSSLPVISTT